MDFEFSMLHKTSIVLLSGAISNSLDRFKIRKLEGRPLYLRENEEVRPMKDQEIHQTRKEISRIFKCKAELRSACLDQLDKSLRAPVNSLTVEYIQNYIARGNKTNVIIVWNGSSDKLILKRLGIRQFPILNITCYDKHFNKKFFLQLEKLETKQLLFEVEVGTYDKSGRLLNLEEAHRIICVKKHKLTHAHDPRTDVILTKCTFDFIVRRYGYGNLVANFS